MKDEAFDELARRQGGGFQAKRQMAADKLQEPPSEWASIKAILDEYGLQAIDFVADFKAALAQPAQEPVHSVQSNGRHSPLLTHMMNKRTAPPQRPWVGLTDEEIAEIRLKSFDSIATNRKVYEAIEAKLKERNS